MTCSKTPPAKPANLGFILQQPHLWTRRHEEYLKVKIERDVVAEKVIGETNLPRDGDEEFEALAAKFTQPTMEDLMAHPWNTTEYRGNCFTRAFQVLGEMIELTEVTEPDTDTENEGSSTSESFGARYYRLSRKHVGMLVAAVQGELQMRTHLYTRMGNVRFHIESCKVRGTLRCDGSLVRCSDIRAKTTFPIATFSGVHVRRRGSPITHEIPHILIQAVLAFQQNAQLGHYYHGYMIRQEGVYLTIGSATVSRAYVQRVQAGQTPEPSQGIRLTRTAAYDLRYAEGRREAMRSLVGMLRGVDRQYSA